MSFANRLALPVEDIIEQLNKGYAHAALESDLQQKTSCRVAGSPTLNFNEGRQSLYGNVGYRIMEANVEELLQDSSQHASWC